MKQLLSIFAAVFALAFTACSGEPPKNVEPRAVVGKSLEGATFNDQFDKPHTIASDTTKVVMVFSKDKGHEVNEFFASKTPRFMAEHHVQFIADMSSAPSVIRSMFIIPGLKDFKHTVLLITDDATSAAYKPAGHEEQIMILTLERYKITAVDYVDDTQALSKALRASGS